MNSDRSHDPNGDLDARLRELPIQSIGSEARDRLLAGIAAAERSAVIRSGSRPFRWPLAIAAAALLITMAGVIRLGLSIPHRNGPPTGGSPTQTPVRMAINAPGLHAGGRTSEINIERWRILHQSPQNTLDPRSTQP